MGRAAQDLLRSLELIGYKGSVISVKHLSAFRREIEGSFKRRMLDSKFYQSRLKVFDFAIPSDLREAQSILTVAIPRPHAEAIFSFSGKKITLILPPTYVGYQKTTALAEATLNKLLGGNYRIARASLPLKLLAVRSGLARYVRNNITYVSGMGSFLQHSAFFSDMSPELDQWQEKQEMARCKGCGICQKACPTGAIGSDRFVLHAERCISYHNEKKGTIPFPSWLTPTWHNSLFGCLHCQSVCPENKPFLNNVGEKEEFSQEETELLMHYPIKNLSEATIQKLKNLDLADAESLGSLPRNLRVLVR